MIVQIDKLVVASMVGFWLLKLLYHNPYREDVRRVASGRHWHHLKPRAYMET
jgi:hypothetical protein